MTTQYPGAIDGYAQIRIVADRLDEVVARDHNDLRSAVLAIEQTLGLNPQGIFGTVVERLEDAYGSLQAHVGGLPPRHRDWVIESTAKPGSPHFSLYEGTVASQLQELLDYVNAPRYSGSLPTKFANGEFMGPSTIETAITALVEVIRDIHYFGGWDGYGELWDGYIFPASTIGQGMDQIIAQFGGRYGSYKIGSPAFTAGERLPFESTSIGQQVRIAGQYIAEHGALLSDALAGFIVAGLGVTRTSSTQVSIDGGDICVAGRFATYGGGTFTHSGIGVHHIYATVGITGEVIIQDSNNPDVYMGVNGHQPTVPLVAFNETGAAWAEESDLHRFGKFLNNKPYLTVGNDAYGADFVSLRDAIAYVGELQSTSGGINKPRKIVLVGDVYVPAEDLPLPIWSDMEIDGGNHTIEWAEDTPLFSSEDATNVSFRNIRANYSGAAGAVNTAFYHAFAGTQAIREIFVRDCYQYSEAGNRVYNFLKFEDGGSYSISLVEVTNCVAEVVSSGVFTPLGSSTIQAARVSNCAFYQSTITSVPEACVRVGRGSMVTDNIISGGYGIGIQAWSGETTIIHGNRIRGGDGTAALFGAAYMDVGIQLVSEAVEFSSRSIISDNIVKGFMSYGITAIAGASTSQNLIISGNMVDNMHDDATLATGIQCLGSQTLVLGNFILGAAVYAIENASQAIGNIIWDYQGSPTAAILVNPGAENALVAGNYIWQFVAPLGIDGGAAQKSKILNNILVAALGTTPNAIAVTGQQSIVAGNYIARYGGITTDTTITAAANSVVVANNYLENCQGVAVNFDGNGFGLVHGNYMIGAANASAAVDNFGQRMCITNNFIYNYSANAPVVVMRAISAPSAPYALIAGNHLVGCKGVGVELAGNDLAMVHGNYMVGSASSTSGVLGVGGKSIVSDNLIDWYGYDDGYGIATENGKGSIISGNVISVPKATMVAGIGLGGGSDAVTVANNSMGLNTGPMFQVGIDLWHSIGSLVIGNRIVGEQAATYGAKPAITNVGNGTMVVDNRILTPNGGGIWAINSVWCLIAGNQVVYPPSGTLDGPFGIVAWRCGDISIVSNQILADHANGAGIYVPSSDRCAIVGNNVWQHSTGIWLRNLDSDPSEYCLVACNYLQTSDYAGIYVDTGCIGSSVVGNYIINVDVGIDVWTAETAVLSNFITDYVDYAIDLHGADECCVVGNMARFPDGATTNVDGMDLGGVIQSLVVGNWMEAKGAGTGFIIDVTNPTNGLVMAGNLSRAGVAPNDGTGGTWAGTAAIDTWNCRHIP